MISFLGLITFLLRLTLAIQAQMVTFLPADFFQESLCVTSESTHHEIQAVPLQDKSSTLALCEAESEEKSESETETLANLLQAFNEAGFFQENTSYSNPFFGNKSLQGGLHLYDLFHSWKTHLS